MRFGALGSRLVWNRAALPDIRVICAFLVLIPAIAVSQTLPRERFEVASIKAGGDIFSTRPNRAGGRFRWVTQLCYLIGYAYSLDFSRVEGKPCGAIYSLEATFDPSATDDQVRSMIQSLLTERFKLRTHLITTEAEGFALVVGKSGPKVKEAETSSEPDQKTESFVAASSTPGIIAITGQNASMRQLAETLQRVTKTPVWDRTGLHGNYDFAFRYADPGNGDFQVDAPSFTTGLQEALGLKLEKRKGPLETLVIDSIEKPLEN